MNVYMPAEAVIPERRRFLDWRFLAALTALILVAFLVFAGIRNYQVRAEEAAQKQALIAELSQRAEQITSLERDITRLTTAARSDRREASRERERLLRQQRRMIRLLLRFGVEPPAAAAASVAPEPPATSEPAASAEQASDRPERPQDRPQRPANPRPDPPSRPEPRPDPEPSLLDWLLPDLPGLP